MQIQKKVRLEHTYQIKINLLPAAFVDDVDGVTLACLLFLPEDGLEDDDAIFPDEGEAEKEGDTDWQDASLSAPNDPRLTDNFLELSSSFVRI